MSDQVENAARMKINSLLDPNSFVEIGANITARNTDFNYKEKKAPGDGVITGYGVINGGLVYVYSQDSSVLNGTVGEVHAQKIIKLYDMALKMGAPVIGLIDCGGIRIAEGNDAMNGLGELYRKQCKASGVIPQITGIFGNCGGGISLLPAMSDFIFMEGKKARLFINSPNTLTGNEESRFNTASAEFNSRESGLADVVGEEAYILEEIRKLVTILPSNNKEFATQEMINDDLNRSCTDAVNYSGASDKLIADIADNNEFYEVKRAYAREMVTGFIRINGTTVGAIANRTELYNEEGELAEKFDNVLTPGGCRKAAAFIDFCDAFNIPILTFTNVKGFEATIEAEKEMAGAAGKLTYSFASASVPKVNIIVGEAYGSAYNVMNSKALGADIVCAWPKAVVAPMESLVAAKIMYSECELSVIKEKSEEYKKLQGSLEAALGRGYVDYIISPEDTRKYVISSFEMLCGKREGTPYKKHGTI